MFGSLRVLMGSPSPRVRAGSAHIARLVPLFALIVASAVLPPSERAAASVAPTIETISPSYGSTAGSTSVTVTGSGFTGTTGVTVGGAAATSVNVVSDTELSLVTPAGTRGAQAVVVTNGTGSSTEDISFTYLDILVSTPGRVVGFEKREERFVLGELASRTQQRPFTGKQAAGPGLSRIFGIDSLTGASYSFLTDQGNVIGFTNGAPSTGGANEGFEWNLVAGRNPTFSASVTSTTTGGRQVITLNAPYGFSCAAIGGDNAATPVAFHNDLGRFCSVFGPEIWSNAFSASEGEALSFEYSANSTDQYEPYAYLVKVTDLGGGRFSYGGTRDADPDEEEQTETHSIVLYARGNNTSNQGGYVPASGNIPSTGHYRFRFVNGSFDGSGGSVLGAAFSLDALSIAVAQAHTLDFPSPGDQIGATGTFTITITSSAGRDITITSSDATKCDFASGSDPALAEVTGVTSGSTVTVRKRAVGTCTLLARSDSGLGTGGLEYAQAPLTSRTIEIRAESVKPANIARPSITGSTDSGTTLSVNEGDWSDGGAAFSGTTYQWRATKGGVTSAINGATAATFCIPDDADIIGATLSVEVTKTNEKGSTTAASGETAAVTSVGQCAPPPAPPAPDPEPEPVVAPPLPPGPVLTSGAPPRPSPRPTARVGDVEVPVASTPAGTTRTEGTTTVSTATILEVGTVAVAVDVTGAGEVRTTTGAAPEVRVVRGAVARTSGGGLLPGTQVQAWLPLAGTNARPVVTLPVAEDGTFTGELPFDARSDRQSDGRPLPIGTHVLQLFGVDAAGQVTVIEQTVRIEQPAPSPEPDRTAGAPPALTPGASIATNAGLPEAVTVVPVPDQRQARVEGSGWTMAVDIPSADGRVAPAEGGGALIELVEDDVAEVSGDGFLGGTRADVWLFSTPTLLGSVTIAADGTFSGEVDVTGIATGEHTLQLQGVGADGYVRAANLGVVVVPRTAPTPEPAPEPEPEPEPQPEEPEERVEVVTASGEDTGSSNLLLWIALAVAAAGSGWWFLLGRRQRDEDELPEGTHPD